VGNWDLYDENQATPLNKGPHTAGVNEGFTDDTIQRAHWIGFALTLTPRQLTVVGTEVRPQDLPGPETMQVFICVPLDAAQDRMVGLDRPDLLANTKAAILEHCDFDVDHMYSINKSGSVTLASFFEWFNDQQNRVFFHAYIRLLHVVYVGTIRVTRSLEQRIFNTTQFYLDASTGRRRYRTVDKYFNAIMKLVGEAPENPVEANNVIPDIAQVFYNGLADNLKTTRVEQALPALPPASLPDKLSAHRVLKEAAEEQEKDINSTRKIASAAVAAQSSCNSNRQTTNMISDATTNARISIV
jgi:hypothetical protein